MNHASAIDVEIKSSAIEIHLRWFQPKRLAGNEYQQQAFYILFRIAASPHRRIAAPLRAVQLGDMALARCVVGKTD